jgi:hypothetical protein
LGFFLPEISHKPRFSVPLSNYIDKNYVFIRH